jgi:cysteine desulfurase family protein (TIGR01976 family)
LLEQARLTAASFLRCEPAEAFFGANMTTLNFHLSRAIGRGLKPGDEIIVTELDHHANVDPWRAVARDRDLVVKSVKLITETGQLDWDHFASLLNSKTKLVAMGAASNALGTINDVRKAGKMAHAAGAKMFVDAVHFAPHSLVDVRDLDCDFLACSAYKFNGPHIGILYAKRAELESLSFPKLLPAHDTAPERAETGTLNHEGIVGAGAAVDFFASLTEIDGTRREKIAAVFDEVHFRNSLLLANLWAGLESIDGVTLYGPTPEFPRTPTVAFTVKGLSSREVASALAKRGLFLSHGDFYASTVIERLGLSDAGLVRAGCAIYTSMDEIARLIDGVRSLV